MLANTTFLCHLAADGLGGTNSLLPCGAVCVASVHDDGMYSAT